jgi:hypothetical protein
MKFLPLRGLAENDRRRLKKWRKLLKRRLLIALRKNGTSNLRDLPSVSREIIRIIPPADFSFSRNYDATVKCLRAFKKAVFSRTSDGRPSTIFLDLSAIEHISLAGALVLGAEFHRWSDHRRSRLRASNIDEWKPNVRNILDNLGFFELLNVRIPRTIEMEPLDSEITVLPMISSTKLDAELLQKTLVQLNTVAQILHQDPFIYGALVQAAYNAKLHAYPEEHEYEFPPTIKGWWATASWNPVDGHVKFLVYDQGVGIPATLPRWQGWESVRSWLVAKLGPLGVNLNDASHLIEAALAVDRTSLEGGHGKGLQDVVAVVRSTAGSSVRILSGTGTVLYHYNGLVEKKDEMLHIGGTLVEWRIPVRIHEDR